MFSVLFNIRDDDGCFAGAFYLLLWLACNNTLSASIDSNLKKNLTLCSYFFSVMCNAIYPKKFHSFSNFCSSNFGSSTCPDMVNHHNLTTTTAERMEYSFEQI